MNRIQFEPLQFEPPPPLGWYGGEMRSGLGWYGGEMRSGLGDVPAGTSIVQAPGDPKVYLVGPGGKWWIPGPADAVLLAGDAWASTIKTISAADLAAYKDAKGPAEVAKKGISWGWIAAGTGAAAVAALGLVYALSGSKAAKPALAGMGRKSRRKGRKSRKSSDWQMLTF